MQAINLRELWQSGQSPVSFAGETKFSRHTGASRGLLRQEVFPYLSTYTKYRVAKRPRVYNPYFTKTKRTVIQSDIIFMNQPPSMIEQNNGFRYILIVQDIFSRKIWAEALRRKDAETVGQALRPILVEMAPFRANSRFVIDRGTEFLNRNVRNLLESFHLSIIHPSDGHASHVERANLSLQRLLFQRMEEVGGDRVWIDYLPQAVQQMNERRHRIIRMSPNEAEQEDQRDKVNEAMSLYRQKALTKEYKRSGRRVAPRFRVGDLVRIQKEKRVFNRGYKPTFTSEVFKIKEVLRNLPITRYTITEWDGTEIEGNFYAEELTLVKGNVFKVESVLRRGIRNGVPSALVKWEGFADKYNSWVRLRDLQE